MKTHVFFIKRLFLISILSFLILGNIQAQKDVSAEIQKINNIITDAFKNGDFEKMSSFYLDDVKVFPPNMAPMQGSAAISGMMQALQSMGLEGIEYETVSAVAYGDVALEEGKYKIKASGGIVVDHGKYLVTWNKINNEWKISRDIWNTSTPTMPKATSTDTVLIVRAKIKAQDRQKALDYTKKYYGSALQEFYPDVKLRSRLFYQIDPDKEGNLTMFYFVDPYYSSDNHNAKSVISKKFEADIERIMKEFESFSMEQKAFWLNPVEY